MEEMAWNAQKVLENKDIDSVILNMGSSNIWSKPTLVKTEIEIVNNILKTVDFPSERCEQCLHFWYYL